MSGSHAVFDVPQQCPHCELLERALDDHIAAAHGDLPTCNAKINNAGTEGQTIPCVFRVGHRDESGNYHAGPIDRYGSRLRWNDGAMGATPHRPPEPSDSLDKLKAAGVVSHTVVATGDGSPARTCGEHDGPCFPEAGAKCSAHGEQQCARCHRNPSDCLTEDGACGRWSWSGMHWDTCPNRRRGPLADADSPPQPPEWPVKATCAVLHMDGQGNTIPCPDDQADRHPALTAKLYAPSPDDRLRDAEIRAAVAEHEAEAYKNQVQALVRALLRERGAAEEDLPQKVSVIILHEEAP